MEHAGPSHVTLRRPGERYLPQFKERVIAYSRNHTFVETARQFHVHHTTVAEWSKEKNKAKKQTEHLETKEISPEQKFREWLEPLCQAGNPIEKQFLISKALEILPVLDGNDWFSSWVSRLSQEEKKNNNSHINYPIWFKNCVCNFTKSSSQRLAVDLFVLSRKRVWEWMQGIDQQTKTRGCKEGRAVTDTSIDEELVRWVQTEFQNTPPKGSIVRLKAQQLYKDAGYTMACSKGWFVKWAKRHKLTASPRVVLKSNLEDELIQWMLTQLDRHSAVTHALLREKAAELARGTGTTTQTKLSASWAVRFLHRHSRLLQGEADETNFPAQMQEDAKVFRKSLEHMFFLGCMDELPLQFPCPLEGMERPIETTNTKKVVLLPRCASDNSHVALVLAALEDGRLLPPGLLIKEEIGELTECPEVKAGQILLLHQSEAIMDQICMRQWIQNIWFTHVEIPNALVVDCLDAHEDVVVRCSMAEISCHVAVMPGGCSSLLQPLHSGGLAKWFLARLQERWTQHLAMIPISERPLLPDMKDLIRWLAELYIMSQAAPQQEMIREGFKSAGLRPELLF